MKRWMSKVSLFMTFATLLISLLSGCGKGGVVKSFGNNSDADQTTYPLKTDITLKYWLTNSPPVSDLTEKSQYPWFKEWEKRTGVKIKYVFPPIGQEQQSFNIMIASGEIPDIVEYSWYNFNGGPDKAISDGYITKLNELIDKYAPNYKKFLSDNPDYNKMLMTDNGNQIMFSSAFEPGYAKKMTPTSGYIMRKDWLEELGLATPTTIDEWYTVLKAFKDKKGVESPMCMPMNNIGYGISAAFGAPFDYFQENGKVKYGLMESGFKDFLITMKQWYNEGLLDSNFISLDSKMIAYKITSGKSGVVFGYIGANIGQWMKSAPQKDAKFDLVGVPYPILNKEQETRFVSFQLPVGGIGAAISDKSKYKELAARLLDYAYSQEGHMFFNFGVEGASYKIDNGYPKYTDDILKNSNGLSVSQAMQVNIRGNAPSPSIQDHRYLEQYYQLPQQKDALVAWGKVDSLTYKMPLVSYTPDESAEILKLTSDINTYCDEMKVKFIIGKEPMENYNKFIAKIKELGIERIIEIKQVALDRYNKK